MDSLNAKRLQILDALTRRFGPRGLTAADIMTRNPRCVRADVSVRDVVELFRDNGFRHLLVIDDAQRLIGVLSDRDILRLLGPQPRLEHLSSLPAFNSITTDLITIGPDTCLRDAVALMIEQGISCLPVLTEAQPEGILTNTDLYVLLDVLLRTEGASAQDPAFGLSAATG